MKGNTSSVVFHWDRNYSSARLNFLEIYCTESCRFWESRHFIPCSGDFEEFVEANHFKASRKCSHQNTRQTSLEESPPFPVNVTSESLGSPSCHETSDFPTSFPFSIIAERRFFIIRRFGCESDISTHDSEHFSCFLIVNKSTKTTLSRSVSLLPPTMRDV